MLPSCMSRRLAALAAAGAFAAALPGGAAAAPAEVTLGGTGGTPSGNICVAGFNCTYVPFHLNESTPLLVVPFDGTVTGFAVNAGSTGGKVALRVLRPAAGGGYTGAGTTAAQTVATLGVNRFDASLPVKAGDVLGLDNDSSAILFDTSDATYLEGYWNPALADGATAAPPYTRDGYRLLLSATVEKAQEGPSNPARPAPTITHVRQSHARWREGRKLATIARARRAPVGTTFSFRLNVRARVRFAFTQLRAGRRVGGRCVAATRRNRHRRACTRATLRGSLTATASAGAHRLSFQGRLSRKRRLPLGRYRVRIAATAGGQTSAGRTLRFTIVR